MKFKQYLPAVGIAAGLCLLVVATRYYSGGTTDSNSTIGYSWAHNFFSSLFAARALNGAANPARYFAIPAMLLLCVSLATIFKQISSKAGSRTHRKSIEVGGIGSMVYAFLVVTPMHDLMLNIALPLALVALLAMLHSLYISVYYAVRASHA